MKIFHIFPKIFQHGCLIISTFHSLKYHTCTIKIQLIQSDKGKSSQNSFLRKTLVLQLSAHAHQLFKKLPDPFFVEICRHLFRYCCQLLILSCLIKYLASVLYLIFCNSFADFHTSLIKRGDLVIDHIQLFSHLFQTLHRPTPYRFILMSSYADITNFSL